MKHMIAALFYTVRYQELVAISSPKYFADITENSTSKSFITKQEALDFIAAHKDDRKFWDFHLFECREIAQ